MSRAPRVALSVVIPAFNEAGRIGATIEEVTATFAHMGRALEIIVVDDGSLDNTAEVVREKAKKHAWVRLESAGAHVGKGAAARRGIAVSKGAEVLVVDADLAIPLWEYPGFSRLLAQGAGVVIASKELGRRAGTVSQPRLRVLMGRVFNLAVRMLVLPGVTDSQAGFKLFGGKLAREIIRESVVDGFAFDVELLALVRLAGWEVAERAVSCNSGGHSSVRVLADSVKMLLEILSIRRRLGRVKASGRVRDA